MATDDVLKAALHARRTGEELAQLVGEKQMAYGDAAGLQAGLWKVLLAQFKVQEDTTYYAIPVGFMEYDVPRLTRVFDRIARIIARAKEGDDAMGESPWRDLAGDAIVGASVQARRSEPMCTATHPNTGHGCERATPHEFEDEHRYTHAGGVVRWTYSAGPGYHPKADGAAQRQAQRRQKREVCGAVDPETGRTCTLKPPVHSGGHKHYAKPDAEHPEQHGWWGEADSIPVDPPDEYTHGYTPEEGE